MSVYTVLARLAAVAFVLGFALSGAPAAEPAVHSTYRLLPGFDVPGTPAALDRIAWVERAAGARAPGAVVILVPGFMGGAENFRYFGERLVQRLPWVQVWAVDRRNNLLENRSAMELAQLFGNPGLAAAYYFGGVDLPLCPPHFDPDPAVWNGWAREFALSQPEANALGMARWGLETELEDIRRLIAYAHARYPRAKVFLGGHSLGGMTAQLYAGWRFGGTASTAGWREIDGIILIDGGVDGPNWQPLLIGQYIRDLGFIASGMVFWEDPSMGAAPFVGQLAEVAAFAASVAPTAESFLWPSLPPPFTWPDARTAPTNKALFAAFTDNDTGFEPTFELRQGRLAVPVDLNGDGLPDMAAGGTRFLAHWTDFNQTTPPELSSADVWARALWQSWATNGVEWHFSIRLNADIDLASNLDSTALFRHPVSGEMVSAAELEGQRVLDTARVAIPVYAFAAAEGRERFDWYRSVATGVTDFTLVDHSDEGTTTPSPNPYSHLDPLFAADTGGFTNACIASLAQWLTARR